MAISVNFAGSNILKPGAYSELFIDTGSNFSLGVTGIVGLIGEADAGKPGLAGPFQADQVTQLKQVFKSGPLMDAISFAFNPGSDSAITSGAQAIYVYKTNASARASLAIANSYGTLYSTEYGTGGNRVSYKNVLSAEVAANVSGSLTLDSATADIGKNLTLSFIVNGVALAQYTIPASLSLADLVSQLNAAAGLNGLSFSVIGSGAASGIKVFQDAGSNLHRRGAGRSFEIVASAGQAALKLPVGLVTASAEPKASLQIKNNRDGVVVSDTVGGAIIMSIGYAGSNPTASVSITATQMMIVDSSTVTLDLDQFNTISEIVAHINMIPDWSASLSSALVGQYSPSVLDKVTSIGAVSVADKPVRIKYDAASVLNFFASSIYASISNPGVCGLPDARSEVSLSGGSKGATSDTDILNGLSAFTKYRINSIIPLFSRDATADIADLLTDPASSYTIASIHQNVSSHVNFMAQTKKKSERQAYLSLKDTYENCKEAAATIANFRCQLFIQDVKQSDSNGKIKWFMPYALAALAAGARAGMSIGMPLTHKYLNISGLRQTGQAMSTAEEDIIIDFDPDTMYDEAINSGITFLEAPQTNGFRVVVDNTTYGKDSNWVLNRGNVLYAADVLSFDFRNQMENIYVGAKNNLLANEVKSVAASILSTYLSQGITVATPEAPGGYKGLTIKIVGNTIYVDVTVVLIEGIDFVLERITVTRNVQSA